MTLQRGAAMKATQATNGFGDTGYATGVSRSIDDFTALPAKTLTGELTRVAERLEALADRLGGLQARAFGAGTLLGTARPPSEGIMQALMVRMEESLEAAEQAAGNLDSAIG